MRGPRLPALLMIIGTSQHGTWRGRGNVVFYFYFSIYYYYLHQSPQEMRGGDAVAQV